MTRSYRLASLKSFTGFRQVLWLPRVSREIVRVVLRGDSLGFKRKKEVVMSVSISTTSLSCSRHKLCHPSFQCRTDYLMFGLLLGGVLTREVVNFIPHHDSRYLDFNGLNRFPFFWFRVHLKSTPRHVSLTYKRPEPVRLGSSERHSEVQCPGWSFSQESECFLRRSSVQNVLRNSSSSIDQREWYDASVCRFPRPSSRTISRCRQVPCHWYEVCLWLRHKTRGK